MGRGHLQLATPQLMSLMLSKHNSGQQAHLHCVSDSEGEKSSRRRRLRAGEGGGPAEPLPRLRTGPAALP